MILFCSRDKNPVLPLNQDGSTGNLKIRTEKSAYYWQAGESDKMIIIHGTLVNNSSNRYFSRVGARMGKAEQDLLFIAGNSAACIEEFNETDNTWHKSEIMAFLIEGTRFVPLEPSIIYSLNGHLSIKTNQQQKGIFRIRIDYYNTPGPGSEIKPMKDYSNIFEIQ